MVFQEVQVSNSLASASLGKSMNIFLEDELKGDSPYCSSVERKEQWKSWLSLVIKFVSPRSSTLHHKILVHLKKRFSGKKCTS